MTPRVLLPSLSTSLAAFKASELARSSVPLETAKTIEFGFFRYGSISALTFYSISLG